MSARYAIVGDPSCEPFTLAEYQADNHDGDPEDVERLRKLGVGEVAEFDGGAGGEFAIVRVDLRDRDALGRLEDAGDEDDHGRDDDWGSP